MSWWKQALYISFWLIYHDSPVSLNLYIFSLFLMNALYANPGFLKCITEINLSLSNKTLFAISFVLFIVLTCLILLK